MEDQLKTEIRDKITAGFYRLLIHRPNKQDILENYAKIINDDGSIVKGYVCCTKCLQLFKSNSNLNKHRCFFGPCLRKLHTDCIDKHKHDSPEFENEIITITEPPLKEDMKKSQLSIWEKFDLTLNDAGGIVDGLISCRQCNMILKYDNTIPSIALTHKCLAVNEGNGCLKDMPTQREIFAKIKLEISRNLNAGIYKLTLNRRDNSSLWRVYSLIEREDESILSGYIYCTKCKQVLRNGGRFTNRLYKHECFSTTTKTGGELDITQLSSQESSDETISELNNDSVEDIPIQISIWHTFVLTLRDNGNSVTALISCRLCNMTFKCETITKRQMHKCLAVNEGESLQMLPSQRQIKDKINLEITHKLKAGIFTLKINEVRRSMVWKVFALIVKTDGSILSGYACCIKCGKVKKVERMQANQLNRHSCFVNSQYNGNKSNKNKRPYQKHSKKELELKKLDIKKKISTGEYNFVMRENCKSVAWKFFANITKNDGTPLERFLYCTKCTVVKSFDGTRTGDLRNHKCVLDYLDNVQEEGNYWSNNITLKDTKHASQNLKNADTIKNHSYNIQHLLPGKIKITSKNIQNNFVQEILNDQQPTIWSRFELIPLDDGSILEQMVSCRQCRMVLKYDGSTKLHLEDHICYSMAPSLPMTEISNRNHVEFIPDSQQNTPIETATSNAAEKEISNGYSIMYMEEELNCQNSREYIEYNSLNESLPDIEEFQDRFSNEFTNIN